MSRTSETHPLQIHHVAPEGHPGRIGMTFCPGKHQPDAVTGAWARDLQTDIAAVAAWGARALVCLVEAHELDALHVPGLGAAARSAGLEFHHLPIRDVHVPDEGFERLWTWSGPRLRALLTRGESIVVHCKGGLGRTGLLAARLLVEFGEDPVSAVTRVKAARAGAIETKEQRQHVLAATPCPAVGRDSPSAEERVLGCLLGGAVGDALGYAVEFDAWPEIQARYGPSGIQVPVAKQGRYHVSDDTQMTLFTLEAVNDRLAGEGLDDVRGVTEQVRQAYLDWLFTQSHDAARMAAGPTGSRLRDARVLCVQRAPGHTCTTALEAGGSGTPERHVNTSKGCGGVMRVAPLGLMPAQVDAPHAFELGARAAAVTHTHPTGYIAAGVMTALIRELCDGRDVREALASALAIARRWPGHEETLAAVDTALALADQPVPGPAAEQAARVTSLGGGWIAEEALAIGVYAALVGAGFEQVLTIAANHGGDSDSTASIAGQIYGAWQGPWPAAGELPHSWVSDLDVLAPALVETGRLWQLLRP